MLRPISAAELARIVSYAQAHATKDARGLQVSSLGAESVKIEIGRQNESNNKTPQKARGRTVQGEFSWRSGLSACLGWPIQHVTHA